MRYDEFKQAVEAVGLTPRLCNPWTYQIRGGKFLVNFYPSTKRGQRFYINCTAGGATGSLEQAIAAATGNFTLRPNIAKRPSPGKVKRLKKNLMKTHPNCCYCGIKIVPAIASLDHFVPRIKGGGDFLENYRLCCLNCNALKGDKIPVGEDGPYRTSISAGDVGHLEFPQTLVYGDKQ